MGLTNGALQIGQSALLAYQSALQVVGNNIANAGTTGYTRQTPEMTGMAGEPIAGGLMPGGGVALTALQRNLDEALNSQVRTAVGNEQKSLTQQQSLSQIESLYNELSGQDLSTQINAFFSAFQDVQNQPLDEPTRNVAISTGQSLAGQIQDTRSGLVDMYGQINKQIGTAVTQVNDLTKQIADLNREIVRAESGSKGAASSLRDQRDVALQQLAQDLDIQTSETPEGAVNVFVGNQPLVQLTSARQLTTSAEQSPYGAAPRVCFADDNDPLTVSGGQIAGLMTSRDQYVAGQIQQLDAVASALIGQVNRLHSQGQGLDGLTDVTGAFGVKDPVAALNSATAGLSGTLTNGSFKLTVGQITEDPTTGEQTVTQKQEYVIPVTLTGLGADTSLNDLVSYINTNVGSVSASVTAGNQLQLKAANGYSFTFSEDSSGALAGLGMNVFFTGHDAGDIAVESNLASHPRLLAASQTGAPGDGGNAGSISALATTGVADLNGLSVSQQWQLVVSGLASTSASAKSTSEATHTVSQSLQSQQQSISGVNTDEEAVNLMQYQRGYQAAARYISVVDQLVTELLSLIK